jgi:phosphoglycerate kinase
MDGLDIGTYACEQFANVIRQSKVILWNGPMGVFEMHKFQHGTRTIAEAIAKATELGAYSLVGGGDSVAAVNQFGLADKVSYVSTGGERCSSILKERELPGIAALK